MSGMEGGDGHTAYYLQRGERGYAVCDLRRTACLAYLRLF